MKKNQSFNGLKEIESNFSISKNGLLVLFSVSVIGVLTGLSGWIFNPRFLWNFPISYFIIMTTTGFVLLGLTYTVKIFTSNIDLALKEYRTQG